MSEEQIIKILKDTISLFNNDTYCFTHSDNERVEAIQSLVYLYNKEKEKNKILDNMLLVNKEQYEFIKNKDNYISKDKIREKIEELLEHKENINEKFDKAFYNLTDIIEFEIKVLQELLEERD